MGYKHYTFPVCVLKNNRVLKCYNYVKKNNCLLFLLDMKHLFAILILREQTFEARKNRAQEGVQADAVKAAQTDIMKDIQKERRRWKMYIDFTKQDNVKARIRRRRRALINGRRKKAAIRARIPIIVITVCMIAGLAGYIGVHDGRISDTGLIYTAHAEEKVIYKNVVVKSGDTIWGIASDYADPSKDIRKFIKEICEVNDIKPGNIYPGQVIVVPVKANFA